MQEDLSTRYLLYLRDMSRQIIFSTSSGAGNYSQVLIQGRKKKKVAPAGDTSAKIGRAGGDLILFFILLFAPLSPFSFLGKK